MIMPILSVKNFAVSKKFYTETLGFKQSVSMNDENGNEVFGIFELGKAGFGLGIDPQGPTPGATVQFMVYVPDSTDLDQYYADVKARGGAADDLKTEYWGDRKFDIKDPDGYWITLCKTVKPMTQEEAAANNITMTPVNG
ncbi:MAG: VOC family protein [Anaerolineae bacterium]|nr:VOC family protein [Anaerolineae bacterium]